ncbi:aspartate/glutamate racemase family protein [Shinella zoogloeoides]|uniref:aspartate/glutamate racemase family protein n=1 Tax=Shinella zoogloeoides TaxID=352475 RepID=UPI000E6494F6|nr:aspartate/glutamate racemase family protein [Shinella zoogloeoides]
MAAAEPRLRIIFVHTVAGLVEKFKSLTENEFPGIEFLHVVNESLLHDLLKSGPSPANTRRIVQQAVLAAEADARLVVFTCSSTSPAIDIARTMVDVPIVKVDDPMAQKAASIGGRIAIVCTTQSTIAPSRALVEAHARSLDQPVEVEVRLVEGAFDALRAGRRDEHDGLVTAAAGELAARADVLVLAQASLAHLQASLSEGLAIPVLSSPPLLLEELQRRIGEMRQ